MKKLKIQDIDWIIMTMEDQSPMFETFIHIPTGELMNENCDDFDMEDVEKNREDYIFIEPYPSSEGFRIMEDFVRQEVKEEDIQNKLLEALSKNRPFSRFKEMLYGYPEIQTSFYEFKDKRMKEYVISWLALDDIELIIEPIY